MTARGGTELMAARINTIDSELLSKFQIIHSKVNEPLDETKIRVLVLHDLAGDPACDHLKNNGWNKFHQLVFVSNWQMQGFIGHYGIPWSHCRVIRNAIELNKIQEINGTIDEVQLIYYSTPHRGLNILVSAFDEICQERDDITLNVYSSFDLYGWEEKDKEFQPLFDVCKNHPKINYSKSISNEEIRKVLKDMHILAYPSTWMETSCLVLIEAMAEGLICVHPNLGALAETAGGFTSMYQFHENPIEHRKIFKENLLTQIENAKYWNGLIHPMSQQYAHYQYDWRNRKYEWNTLLSELLKRNPDKSLPKLMFNYST